MVRRARLLAIYKKRKYKMQRYSNETQTMAATVIVPNAGNPAVTDFELIVNTDVQGMRKCKNFTLSLIADNPFPIQWALVYVPEGTKTNVMGLPNQSNTTSLYEPNQNVIMSGQLNNSSIVVRRTRLARNLNSGDSIHLLLCAESNNNGGGAINIGTTAQLNYAVSF